MNIDKSLVFACGVGQDLWGEILNIIRFLNGVPPVKYLGLPLITTRLYQEDCIPLIEKVTNKVQGWKGKDLSYIGRLQLVKAVLNSLCVYWILVFLLHMGTIIGINRLRHNFL